MENINPSLEKTFAYMIFGALLALAIGLVTSTTLLSLYHILLAIPAFYFISKANYRNYPKSAWALLGLTLVIIISVVMNQDIAIKGYAPALKAKYFLFGFIAIAPLSWYFKKHSNDKKLKIFMYAFCIATTIATIAGLIGLWTGTNPILMKAAHPTRNSGLFGMLMNYAHNLSLFLIIIFGLVIYREKIKALVGIRFLSAILIINIIGFYFTYTRGAWLGFLVGVPFYFFKNHKKLFLSILTSLCLLGVVAYFVAGDKVIRPASEIERISQWQAAIMAFKERPLLGYGYLNFENYSSKIKVKYGLPASNFQGHAHSNLFEMLGSTGGIGLFFFMLWVLLWAWEAYKSENLIGYITLPFIITFFVGGLTQSTIALGINLFFIMGAYSLSVSAKSIVD